MMHTANQKKKVLFLSPYPEGSAASQRLKYEQYFNYLRGNGYELETSSFVSPEFWKIIYQPGKILPKILYTIRGYLRRINDMFRLGNYDIVYVHLWVTPFGPPFFEWLTGRLSKKLVYDIDDMIYLSGSGIQRMIGYLKGKAKPVRLMKDADHVITCTPDLNEFALQYCAHSSDISSTLDTDRMLNINTYDNTDPVVIGWTGTHSTAQYLYLLTDVFQKLARERNFVLRVIGNFNFHMDGVNYEYVNWSKEREVEDLQKMDIGVYPLNLDSWVMGKSGLKALQYMTFGLPAVATNVGTAINRVISHNENGFLVRTEEEWLITLKYLIDHPEERRRIGLAARRTVEERFSINATRQVYFKIFESLIGKN